MPGRHASLTEAGATDYITKPIDVKRILAIIDRNLPSDVSDRTAWLEDGTDLAEPSPSTSRPGALPR